MKIFRSLAASALMFISLGAFAQNNLFINAQSGLILRKEANDKSEKITTIPNGTLVDVSDAVTKQKETHNGKQGNWRKCSYNGKSGYLFDAFLSEDQPIIAEKTMVENWYVTAKAGLIMRDEPSQEASKILTIPLGTALKYGDVGEVEDAPAIGGVQGNWRRVRYKGKEGYVFDAYLSTHKPK